MILGNDTLILLDGFFFHIWTVFDLLIRCSFLVLEMEALTSLV